jgi:predicted lysophospholipase L1 biosynthesis ABC-type transport system permease subunit
MIWDIFQGCRSDVTFERFREIGIRSALGASRVNILSLVMRQGMILATLGSAIGLLAAAAVSQAMIALLFGISRLDPITYGGAIALLAAVSASRVFGACLAGDEGGSNGGVALRIARQDIRAVGVPADSLRTKVK